MSETSSSAQAAGERPAPPPPAVRPQPDVAALPPPESEPRPRSLPSAPRTLPAPPGRLLGHGLRTLLVLVLVYSLLFNVSVVRGSSMSPGIHDGDRILIEPWSYLVDSVQRGDIIVLRYPLDPRLDYIKRVVGLPGDQIVIAGGHVWVNGALLDEDYAVVSDPQSYLCVSVQNEHYFVLGDNRPRSSDSREFGQVPANCLRGRVDLCVWPLGRAGWLN